MNATHALVNELLQGAMKFGDHLQVITGDPQAGLARRTIEVGEDLAESIETAGILANRIVRAYPQADLTPIADDMLGSFAALATLYPVEAFKWMPCQRAPGKGAGTDDRTKANREAKAAGTERHERIRDNDREIKTQDVAQGDGSAFGRNTANESQILAAIADAQGA